MGLLEYEAFVVTVAGGRNYTLTGIFVGSCRFVGCFVGSGRHRPRRDREATTANPCGVWLHSSWPFSFPSSGRWGLVWWPFRPTLARPSCSLRPCFGRSVGQWGWDCHRGRRSLRGMAPRKPSPRLGFPLRHALQLACPRSASAFRGMHHGAATQGLVTPRSAGYPIPICPPSLGQQAAKVAVWACHLRPRVPSSGSHRPFFGRSTAKRAATRRVPCGRIWPLPATPLCPRGEPPLSDMAVAGHALAALGRTYNNAKIDQCKRQINHITNK